MSSYLTAKDVADLLRINVETVYKLIEEDGLPAVMVSNKWRIEKEHLAAWLDAREGREKEE